MQNSENKINCLIEEITSAFGDVEYPGDNNIASHNCLECQRIKRDYSRKSWKDITIDFFISKHKDSIFMLDPKAYRYYLPAYFIISIEHYYDADIIPSSVIFSLTPPHLKNKHEPYSEGDIKYYLERMEILNLKQRKAVLYFLEFMRKEHGEDWIDSELDSVIGYWKKIVKESKPSK